MNFRKLELEDQPWCPAIVKSGMTDYLRFLFHFLNLYQPAAALLVQALEKCGKYTVVDLCSGSGGAVEKVIRSIHKNHNRSVNFILTDIYPRTDSWLYLAAKTSYAVAYVPYPVNATSVPAELKGFRTLFSGIHHFGPDSVRMIMEDAAAAGEGIAVFDGGDKNIFMVLLILLIHPLALLLFTPFIKPFRWTKLVYTYLVPLIPLGTVWDGVVSIANLYKPSELLTIARSSAKGYDWKAGKVKNRYGLNITYLIGGC